MVPSLSLSSSLNTQFMLRVPSFWKIWEMMYCAMICQRFLPAWKRDKNLMAFLTACSLGFVFYWTIPNHLCSRSCQAACLFFKSFSRHFSIKFLAFSEILNHCLLILMSFYLILRYNFCLVIEKNGYFPVRIKKVVTPVAQMSHFSV